MFNALSRCGDGIIDSALEGSAHTCLHLERVIACSSKRNFLLINTKSHFSVSQLFSSKSVHWNSVSDRAINSAPFCKTNFRRNSDSQYITCSVARYVELNCFFPLKENLLSGSTVRAHSYALEFQVVL